MNIVSVGYPLFPVAPDASGGSEQILWLLDRELVRAGHRSVVIGARGSRVKGDLVETPDASGKITNEVRRRAEQDHLAAIRTALNRYRVDLIHFHGLDFHAYVPNTTVPKLATLHLPLSWYPEHAFRMEGVAFNCVSKSQADGTPWPVVPNGIDVQRYRPAAEPGDYLLWLGRVCPEKGVHLALQVARDAGWPMIVAGPVHPFQTHQDYFEQQVKPLLTGNCRYLGPVQGAAKIELLARARALLVPSLVAETSSLVAMEAAACGTPVIALASGALPEVVEHERTGFVCQSQGEMTEAVPRLHELSRAVVRERALARFDVRRMVQDYIKLYTRVCSESAAAATAGNAVY